MGTRNLTIVVSNGKTKVAQYGRWDGYPSGQGATALSFLTNLVERGRIIDFKTKVDKLKWLSKKNADMVDKDPNWTANYPYLSRDAGAEILLLINTRQIIGLTNKESFAADSLFCEWAYVIDLDKNTFEVYSGFNKDLLSESERFYHLQKENAEYKPIKHVKTYSLNELPTEKDFIAECDPQEVEEEQP